MINVKIWLAINLKIFGIRRNIFIKYFYQIYPIIIQAGKISTDGSGLLPEPERFGSIYKIEPAIMQANTKSTI